MYSNLAHDKKTLNNEEYVQRIMEAESQGGQVSWILHVRAFYIITFVLVGQTKLELQIKH